MSKLRRSLSFILLILFTAQLVYAQDSTASKSKFDKFNEKGEALFKYMPVPLYSKTKEAGDIFGLAKFNLFDLKKSDTISQASKFSEVVTFSTKGRVNVSVSNDLIFSQNKYMILTYFNYLKQPEYILGIGNDVSIDDAEQIQFERWKFSTTFIRKSIGEHGYAGVSLELSNYFSVVLEENSFIIEQDLPGREGGKSMGGGLTVAWDSRDNRYNAYKGMFAILTFLRYSGAIGSDYNFGKMYFDFRKFYNPWYKHVIAFQATTTYCYGEVPFYDLSLMGGEDRMRGYYKGALRDRTLVDGQIEYRVPVWNIFGVVGWVGTGRVAPDYEALSLDGFWLSYGAGLRIRVDKKHNTNLRFDIGFGKGDISAFTINFAEAF